MGFSTFQIETMIRRFARWRSGLWGSPPAGADLEAPARLSEEGRALARGVPPRRSDGPGGPADVPLAEDWAPLPPAVAGELERRAGSFMDPRPPSPPRAAIPRAGAGALPTPPPNIQKEG
ncbi:MAG: hypothetical protein OEV94_10335 [Deltaproteobacteria bacterium]|nr:hypothetical protein [Deltaproteobacteria bacterium]